MFLFALTSLSVATGMKAMELQAPGIGDLRPVHEHSCEHTTRRIDFTDIDWTKDPAEGERESRALEANDFQYHLFQPGDQSPREVWTGTDGVANSAHFNPDWPTKFLIHGFSRGQIEYWLPYGPEWVEAFGRTHSDGVNVIMVDASAGFALLAPLYPAAAVNTQDVGYQVAKVLMQLEDAFGKPLFDLAHCIGHSLGAQACGRMGRTYNAFRQRKMARITAMDPARPMFANGQDLEGARINKNDADYVEAIHSNGGDKEWSRWMSSFLDGHLGLSYPVGHVDYYLNGGRSQPRCDGLHGFEGEVYSHSATCDHGRAWTVYLEALKEPFHGEKCSNFASCHCTTADCTALKHQRSPPSSEAGLGGSQRPQGLVYIRTSGDENKGFLCSDTIMIERPDGMEEICVEEKCYQPLATNGFYDLSRTHTCGLPDETPCEAETTCFNCKNEATWWEHHEFKGQKCGTESCWSTGSCFGSQCDECCNGVTWYWFWGVCN